LATNKGFVQIILAKLSKIRVLVTIKQELMLSATAHALILNFVLFIVIVAVCTIL
jgi:hypothetical protein